MYKVKRRRGAPPTQRSQGDSTNSFQGRETFNPFADDPFTGGQPPSVPDSNGGLPSTFVFTIPCMLFILASHAFWTVDIFLSVS